MMRNPLSRTRTLSVCLGIALATLIPAIHPFQLSAQAPPLTGRDLVRHIRIEQHAQDMVSMPSVAPLFLENDHFSSTLFIVNEGNAALTGRLVLLAPDGALIRDKQVMVPGHDKAEVPVKSLLDTANLKVTWGSMELFDDNGEGSALVGELVITYHGSKSAVNIDEELLMPSMSTSHRLRGLAVQAEASPIVTVNSTSDQPTQFSVKCTTAQDLVQHSFEIQNHQTLVLRPCSDDSNSSIGSDAVEAIAAYAAPRSTGIEIQSADPKSELQAFGLAPTKTAGGLSFVPIAFSDPDEQSANQAIFPGTQVGTITGLTGHYTLKMSVVNYAKEPRTFIVYNAQTNRGTTSFNQIRTMAMAPLSVQTLSLDDSSSPATQSYVVKSDGNPGDVQAQIWSENTVDHARVMFASKDGKDDRNAGMHPWSAARGAQDSLYLYNQSDAKQAVTLKISNGYTLWIKSIALAPHETLRVSPRQLAEEDQLDDSKVPFSLGRGDGEIAWFTSDGGKIRGRVQHVDEMNQVTTSFQCAGYVVFCGIAPISGPTTLKVGETGSFNSYGTYSCVNNLAPQECYGVQNGGTYATYQWSALGSPLVIQGSSTTQSMIAKGVVDGNSSVEVAATNGSCYFTQYDNVYVTPANGDNTPMLTGIMPNVWAPGATVQVTFTGAYFGTNAPTLHFSPSGGISYTMLSYNDNQIVANVNVATGTPNEDVSVTVTNNGYGGTAFYSGTMGHSATSSAVYATVHSPMNTPEITVIAWVNAKAPDIATLPSGANASLVANLADPADCAGLVADWAFLHTAKFIKTSADVYYANIFLLNRTGNSAPPPTIQPVVQQSNGNFRLFNDSGNGGGHYQTGSTPDPCGASAPQTVLNWVSSGQASPYMGASGISPSGEFYQIAEGRVGTTGQSASITLNNRTVPWIWSVIEFDSAGNPTFTNHGMFPTYSVYRNGVLQTTYPQSTVSAFILKDETYQVTPSQIP